MAVDGISLLAQPGEIYGLLGPNGAGKSTTVSCLSGLLQPTAGHCRLFGLDVTRDGPRARTDLGLVPQELALYNELDARANLRFFGRAQGLRGAELNHRMGEMLERVGLAGRDREPVAHFSGGMKRRLNLACGMIHHPRVLLLDEPTVGVDPQSRVKLMELVADERDRGTCILYTTHYMEEAESLCDRIGIVDEGKLISEGSLEELRSKAEQSDLLMLEGSFDIAALREKLGVQLPKAEILVLDATHLNLGIRDASLHLPGIFRCLEDAGAKIRGTTLKRASLESLFIGLTGKELRE